MKTKVARAIRVQTYEGLRHAVEEGLQKGRERAYKYTAFPSEAHIQAYLQEEVLRAVCEYFDFDQQEGP